MDPRISGKTRAVDSVTLMMGFERKCEMIWTRKRPPVRYSSPGIQNGWGGIDSILADCRMVLKQGQIWCTCSICMAFQCPTILYTQLARSLSSASPGKQCRHHPECHWNHRAKTSTTRAGESVEFAFANGEKITLSPSKRTSYCWALKPTVTMFVYFLLWIVVLFYTFTPVFVNYTTILSYNLHLLQ